MAYVPSQEFGELYDAKKGLCEGTMFPDLNLIFCGVRGK
ncbi:spore coat associated protein CotJA [Coprococcus eutactus]|uniref:Spore coat associated protein CotJA n=2 Tax=Lachnospiraceae TaxID=186803 RepID=A0A8I0ALD7_9FIRM|nr:spore coat associated protein CotJA [Coprococcus hominis (ex Liu et al. 2022)]NSC95895.1 spore coat associated protein CotJA [Coprococcus eutactus]RGG34046.1 spore coat associated protein CotJA [Clostridium sp. AF23-6LB]RGG76074.1 spore coat associated protein CotJA [Clostridium sp. AF17-21AC]RGH09601.1 spore coat associated protein CotJA [Clostridium sp. AF15-31]RHP90574.1 spore coat associated protein CotJA [Clostridium sp. AM54-37XD]RHP94349.1 spore coat associated protein CotJA [Clostr